MKREFFKPLDDRCYDIFSRFAAKYASESCERSWSNLLLYMDTYNWHYALIEERLWIVSFEAAYCFFPLGEYTAPEKLAESLQKLSLIVNDDLTCGDIPTDYPERFPEFAEVLTLNDDAGDYDYIYNLNELHSFSGSKLRKRHNQVRQFEREYDGKYAVKTMAFEDLDAVLALAAELSKAYWDSDSGTEERLALGRLKELWHNKACGLSGILLEVDGKLVGFSIYSKLNGAVDCADIHFEKADHSYCGCGAKLTAALVEDLLQKNCLYMNREQDMDLEGLRRAKQALSPDHLFRRLNTEIFLPNS